MEVFKKDWEEWIDHNVALGNCKKILFEKSLNEGYSYNLLKNKLNMDYHISNSSLNSIDKVSLKKAIKIQSDKLEIYKIENFLNREECDKLIEMINSSNLISSQTINVSDKNEVNSFRTSKTSYFENKNELIDNIEDRICKTLGINNRFAEQMQGQKYEIGQEFKLHTDYFNKELLLKSQTIKSQRTWTFMIYLNDMPDNESGGHTSFPYAYLSFQPKMGTAVIWNNLINGSPNVYSSHHGMPILKGEKYIITKWFKESETNFSIKNNICEHHFFPIFHDIGFEKKRLKLDCIDKIKEWVNTNNDKFTKEILMNREVETDVKSNILSFHNIDIKLQESLKNEKGELLSPIEIYHMILISKIVIEKLSLMINLKLYKSTNLNNSSKATYIVMRAFWIDWNGKLYRKFSKNLGADYKVLINNEIPQYKIDQVEEDILMMMWDQYNLEKDFTNDFTKIDEIFKEKQRYEGKIEKISVDLIDEGYYYKKEKISKNIIDEVSYYKKGKKEND